MRAASNSTWARVSTRWSSTSEHFHPGLPEHVQRNRTLLLGVMHGAGFTHIASEWWHYELPGSRELPVIDNSESGPLRLM